MNTHSTRVEHCFSPGIFDAIGGTPLIRLRRAFSRRNLTVFGKLEFLNPSGSLKDRAALGIVQDAWQRGLLQPGGTVVESTSGNMGVALAQICRALGVTFICVVDSRISRQNLSLLRAYGAQVEVVETDPGAADTLTPRLACLRKILDALPTAFWCNQYANVANARAHRRTMQEVVEALDGRVDFVFCATGSCGTLRGCAEYLREQGCATRLVAVDAEGSVIFGQRPARRLIPGHGTARRPELYEPGLESLHVHVTDLECVRGCRVLLATEGILAGGSSGGVVSALLKLEEVEPGARCVAILCDRGERYLDTVYCDQWVEAHFPCARQFLVADAGATEWAQN